MSAPEALASLAGEWAGTNRLWLTPEEPARESRATASLFLVANGRFVAIRYTWAEKGEPQEGFLLVGTEMGTPAVAAVWIDSWHMSDQMMSCEGSLSPRGVVSILGSYAAPPGPDWGWRIVIDPGSRGALKMTMHNISPAGDAALAVEAIYSKSG